MDTNETKVHIALIAGLFVLLVLLTFFIITITRYQRKKRSLLEQNLRNDFYILDKERERISYDLHDDLGSSLSVIKLRLQMLAKNLKGNAPAIQELEKIIDDLMIKIKRISQNLMPRILQRQGLDAALKEFAEIAGESAGIKIHYGYSIDAPDQEMSLHIYRIVQELINNIVKHSKATRVSLTVVEIGNQIELSITDNGVGFDKRKVLNKAGMGLHNIAARTDILKGTLFLTTAPGEGADYLIEIPAYGKNKSRHRG
ncbi:MAG: ATP-binding protein [Ginsengibacter sp.]